MLPAGKRCVPNRANEPTGVSEQGSGSRFGDPRWVETDERNALQVAFGGAVLPRIRDTTAPSGRHPRTQVTRFRLCGRWLSSSRPTPMRTPQLCVIGRTAIALVGLGGRNYTTIGTYLFQTETIRYHEISYRKRPYDGHLLPHCCHRAVERIVSVVIRSQRWELRDACAVYRSLPGQKPYADFRHRAGRGCSLGTGLCVRIFGKMGGF